MKMIRKKGEVTKFQILYEISKREWFLRQKDIAERLDMTIQGISENLKTLVEEGYITTVNGRAPYSLTFKGIDKIKKEALDLKNYSDGILANMDYYKSTWPAIASEDLEKGENVGLYMDDGILYATKARESANAITASSGKKNEDVALESLNGTIEINEGNVLVITVPNAKDGGSKATDLELIKEVHGSGFRKWDVNKDFDRIGVLGTVGYAVCLKLEIPIDIEFAVTKSTVEATKKGLNVLVFVVGKMAKNVIKELESNKINYYFLNAHQKQD